MGVTEDVFDVQEKILAAKRTWPKPYSLGSSASVESDEAYIGSLYWRTSAFHEQTQFGPVAMPPCENHPEKVCEDPAKYPPAILRLTGKFLPLDRGNDDIDPDYTRAVKRAEDYERRYAQMGVFQIHSPDGRPTREECRAAWAKLKALYQSWVDTADELYALTGSIKQGPSMALVAAECLGLEREWASRVQEKAICPFCQKAVRPGVFRCPNAGCNAVLDWKRAYDAGVVTKAEAEEHGVTFSRKSA